MLDKGERYVITINSKNEERSLVIMFHKLDIYWVNKKYSPFYAMTLEEKISHVNKGNYKFPQKIELYYDECDKYDQYWSYYYVSSNAANYITLNATQFIRKIKLDKINILQ